MKWAFLLGSPDISGGTYVIYEHAIRASKQGAKVTIITEEKVDMQRLFWHSEAKSLVWRTYSEVKEEQFDVCIATWWRTVYELYRVSADRYVYFVQSIESKFYQDNEKTIKKLADSTYHLPLEIITEAKWIQKYLKENFDKNSLLVPNGIRKDIYNDHGSIIEARTNSKLRVLVEGPIDVLFKNVPKTIEICKKSKADEIWLLTSSPIDSYPGIDRVFSQVPISETPKIYRSCDVIIKLSYVEGMFGPPLEMFHCGGTSITYNVTGHDEYIIPNVNGLVADKDNDIDVLNYINLLQDSPNILKELKKEALETAKSWPSWAESSKLFYQTIVDICNKPSLTTKKEIEKQSQFLFDWYVLAEQMSSKKGEKPARYHKLKNGVRRNFPSFFEYLRKLKYRMKVLFQKYS